MKEFEEHEPNAPDRDGQTLPARWRGAIAGGIGGLVVGLSSWLAIEIPADQEAPLHTNGDAGLNGLETVALVFGPIAVAGTIGALVAPRVRDWWFRRQIKKDLKALEMGSPLDLPPSKNPYKDYPPGEV